MLVASPTLLDPNFHRAVVLLIEDGADGTLGVVLNQPTGEPVAAHLPNWAHLVAGMPVVFIGGPVQNEVAVGVAENPSPVPDGWSPSLGDIGLLDLTIEPSGLDSIARLRIFSGYAGWEVGQLDDELEEGSWFLLGPHPDDVFTDDPEELWRQVFARQTGPLAAYSRYPDDPNLN